VTPVYSSRGPSLLDRLGGSLRLLLPKLWCEERYHRFADFCRAFLADESAIVFNLPYLRFPYAKVSVLLGTGTGFIWFLCSEMKRSWLRVSSMISKLTDIQSIIKFKKEDDIKNPVAFRR
jgi:hypothetical protein